MKKTIIIAVILIGLVSALLGGCSKSVTAVSNSAIETSSLGNNSVLTIATSPAVESQNSVVSTPSGNITNGSPDTLQAAVPLNITEPSDAATINGDSVTVQGNTVPDATVSINGTVVTADSTGAFSATISLNEGLNAIDVIAIDDNNNQGEVMLLVNAIPSSTTTSYNSESSGS